MTYDSSDDHYERCNPTSRAEAESMRRADEVGALRYALERLAESSVEWMVEEAGAAHCGCDVQWERAEMLAVAKKAFDSAWLRLAR